MFTIHALGYSTNDSAPTLISVVARNYFLLSHFILL
jgi:hypothetical protein